MGEPEEVEALAQADTLCVLCDVADGDKDTLPPATPKTEPTETAVLLQQKRKLDETAGKDVDATANVTERAKLVTAAVFVLARADEFQALRLERASVRVCHSADAQGTNLLLAHAIDRLVQFVATKGGRMIKWSTVRREVLWNYCRRDGLDSIYEFRLPNLATLSTQADALESALQRHGYTSLAALLHELAPQVDAAITAAETQQKQATLMCCPVEGCGYSTTTRRYFTGHMRVHRPEEKQHRCTHDGCTYASYSAQHLVRHMRTHTGERPFKCTHEGCSYAASQKAHLDSHVLTHSGIRPFTCAVAGCGFSCTRSWNLERHKERAHH